MNLFASMILQSFIRLVIYIDQFIVREDGFTIGRHSNSSLQGIDNTVSSIREGRFSLGRFHVWQRVSDFGHVRRIFGRRQ